MALLYNLCAGKTGAIVDSVVIVLMLLFVFQGSKKGFISCFFGFVSTLLALFVAVSFAKPIMKVTGGFFGVRGALETKWIAVFSQRNGFNVDISGQELSGVLSAQALPAILVTAILKNKVGPLPAGTTLASLAGSTAAQLAATLLTGIVLFIATKLLIGIVRGVLNTVAKKIKLLSAINRLLGGIVGLIKILLIISLVISLFSIFPASANMKIFTQSATLSYFYNHNPLLVMLGWFL